MKEFFQSWRGYALWVLFLHYVIVIDVDIIVFEFYVIPIFTEFGVLCPCSFF